MRQNIFFSLSFLLLLASPPLYGSTTLKEKGLMENKILKEATFVDLDFSAFPTLPNFSIPIQKVLYISPAGNDQSGKGTIEAPLRTIARALQRAESGTTLVLRGGIYMESASEGDYRAILVDKPHLTLLAYPGESVEIKASGGIKYGLVIEADDVAICGIKITGFATIGIQISGILRKKIVIANVVVADCAEGIAIWEGKLSHFLIYNTLVKNATTVGIHCGSGQGHHWRLERVEIEMKATSEGNSGADAFAIEKGDNILLVNSRFSGAEADGIDTKATRVVVYGCHVHHVMRNGIKLWHGGDIINSLVHHTGADASIVVEFGPKTRIIHSTIGYHNFGRGSSYNMTFGYDSKAAMEVEIVNSIIFNTSGGAYFNGKAKIKISHSLFYGMENGTLMSIEEDSVEMANGLKALSKYGDSNLIQDPRLDKDFIPLARSPAIRGGKILKKHYPIYDIKGKKRAPSKAPDLGPFEK